MEFKCAYCDSPKESKKSINTDTDIYLKEKGRYYHRDCYIKKLLNKRKDRPTEQEANEKADVLVERVKNEKRELENRDKFYRWIMGFYDSSLPPHYCMKISDIVSGRYEKIPEPIGYDVLLDIYVKMKSYLIKRSMGKSFDNVSHRMNYDLAIVVSNYGDYKRYIEKKKAEKEDVGKIDSVIKEEIKIKKAKKEEDKSFNLLDDIDDLLI